MAMLYDDKRSTLEYPNGGAASRPNGFAPKVPSDALADSAIAFLRLFHPASPWAISSFGASDEVGPARTFDPSEVGVARAFIDALQGKLNVYFSVNRVACKLKKKAAKIDIEEIHYLHVDADLSKTLEWSNSTAVEAEKARVLALLNSYGPPPTIIIWSGGGFQAFWRLSEIIVVNGDKELMLPAERRMQRIAEAFNADACHNADRIMRLPGTINVLGETKIRAGRKRALAELVEYHEDRIYDLEEFPEPHEPPPRANGQRARTRTEGGADEFERARDALHHIPADDYHLYFRIGMALMNAFGDGGFALYREWAMNSIKFNDNEIRQKWRSIKPEGGITIATLFGLAREHGWRDQPFKARDRKCNGGSRQDSTGQNGGVEMNEIPGLKDWPIMESRATHGIVGRIAHLATVSSEADPVAIIATTLVYAGAEFGRAQHVRIGDDAHHSCHFETIVGQSSRARKGTSYGPVRRIFARAESIRMTASSLPFPSGCKLQISDGPLSTGEGLVYAVRDALDGEEGQHDEGVKDKRLLVVEQEFGAALRAFQRTGNNLSMILRMAFDGGRIAPLIKNNRTIATNPHINVVGHITRVELKNLLATTEIWNGLGNRFQWLMARRPKTVAFPRPMPDDEVEEIAKELARVIALAHQRGEEARLGGKLGHEMVMSNSAQDHWVNVYPELTRDHPGILGAVTSRQEAHARRLALTYAQLDGADRIEIDHLEAALAFCRYAFDSAFYLFGETELDPVAQKILEALSGGAKSQTEISGLFDRHLRKERLAAVLTDLQERGRITLATEKTNGAPRKMWSLVE